MRRLVLLTFLPTAFCLNALGTPFKSLLLLTTGHQLIGSIAQHLLTSKTQQSLSEIVKPSPLDLSTIAPWADRIKYTHAYYWSGNLHYINPIEDFPPTTCSADFSNVRNPQRTL